MSLFETFQWGRVLRAIVIVSGVGAVVTFTLWFCIVSIMLVARLDTMAPTQADIDRETNELQAELIENPPQGLNVLFVVQLSLTALFTYWVAGWASRRALTPFHAMFQGSVVGMGVALLYGAFLLFFLIPPLTQLIFNLIFISAGILAGRRAAYRIKKEGPLPEQPKRGPLLASQRRQPLVPGPPLSTYSADPAAAEIYYNLGVTAALGSRRDEAREHFMHVLQLNARHVAAWLQLANLSDTPEQAWNYIQQARAINPNDPGVIEAVNTIWPQVVANARRVAPPGESVNGGSATTTPSLPK